MAPVPLTTDENPQLLKQHDFEKSRYERLNEINYGAYGIVYRARDKETGEIVAMKMLPAHSQTLAEINIHKSLRHHPSIVGFKGVVTNHSHSRVFVVMEYVENDLNTLLYERRRKNSFTNRDIKHVMKQLLEGVAFLHDINGVMHRDLKPSNILINDKGKLKICDFGLSDRFDGTTRESAGDSRVGMMWYRAPELLELGRQTHSSPVDMWSVGCIMAELVLSQPLFQGRSEANQLALIRETIGSSCNRLRAKLGVVGSGRLTPSGLDLLERLLTYYPNARITARDALNHPWFREDKIGDLHAWCNKKLKINFGR